MAGDVASEILDRLPEMAIVVEIIIRFGQLMAHGADSSPRVDSFVRLDY
jgi:hypothetical protein